MRDTVSFKQFFRDLSEDDKEQFNQCSINQQKDWYIGYLENFIGLLLIR
jgi:hypothetical protein